MFRHFQLGLGQIEHLARGDDLIHVFGREHPTTTATAFGPMHLHMVRPRHWLQRATSVTRLPTLRFALLLKTRADRFLLIPIAARRLAAVRTVHT